MTKIRIRQVVLTAVLAMVFPGLAYAAVSGVHAGPQLPAARGLSELTSTDSPAWPLVQQWVKSARGVELLRPEPAQANQVLLALQVTVRSSLGAVVHRTGGILVAQGWLRILGSGSPELPRAVGDWNQYKTGYAGSGSTSLLPVADDVLGGVFAINGGALPGVRGNVYYFAPDTLQWEDLGMGYSSFLQWALSPKVDEFYRGMRWPGWEADVRKLTGARCLSVYPPLWAKGPSIQERSRRPIPASEMYATTFELAKQLKK